MAVSVKEIRKANQEFYCDTYSPASNFRKINLWISLTCAVLIGVLLLMACKTVTLLGYLDDAMRNDLESQEVLDWAVDSVLARFFDIPFCLILIATIAMCVVLIVLFRNIKSYEWHKRKNLLILSFLLYVYAGMLIFAAFHITSNNWAGVMVIVIECILIPSLKLLLPPEFKAPFEKLIKVFELFSQNVIKKL